MIERKILTHPVHFSGHTFWGKPAKVTFMPGSSEKGITWHTRDGAVPVTREHVRLGKRRIELHAPSGEVLSVMEHIAALKWSGIPICLDSTTLPYFATAQEVMNALGPHLRKNHGHCQWVHPENKKLEYCLPENPERKTTFESQKSDTLRLTVFVRFEGIGELAKEYHFPDERVFEKVYSARPLGWPSSAYWVSRFWSFGRWPHKNKFLWAHDAETISAQGVLEEICDHRAQDILGALALVHPRLVAGDIYSHCGNHGTDIGLLKQMVFSQ